MLRTDAGFNSTLAFGRSSAEATEPRMNQAISKVDKIAGYVQKNGIQVAVKEKGLLAGPAPGDPARALDVAIKRVLVKNSMDVDYQGFMNSCRSFVSW